MRLKIRFPRPYRLGLPFNKRKRAQFFLGRPILILISIIFLTAILIFVITKLIDINTMVREKELNNFVLSLGNLLKSQSIKDYGSTDIVTISLPADISSACFIDSNKEVDKFAKKGLSTMTLLGTTKNLFLSPIEKNPSFKLDNIELKDLNPLCIKTKSGKISLKLTSTGNSSLVEANDMLDKDIDCISIVYNGASEEKVDIVFLSYGYEELDSFIEDVNTYLNTFSSIEPIKENLNKFNFFRVDKTGLECSINDFIFCDDFSVKNLASECPNDYVFVLVERNKIKDIAKPIRSSAVSGLAKINTADNRFVLLHEFGHAFADLDDEYVDESYYRYFDMKDSLNCDSSDCPKWFGIEGTACFRGCSLNNFYRSSKESIMRNYYKSKEFGILNSKIINANLEEYR